MNDNLSTIVEGRVCDGIQFAEHRDRLLYIRTLVRNRPQWLKENAGRWRYIKDIQREAASLAAPVKSEIDVGAASSGRNGHTSDVRKNGREESDVTLVDTSADGSSPPSQPESLPATVNENVKSGSTQTELPHEAATRETNEPETETTSLGETGRKRGRSGDRQRKKRKLSAKVLKARRKRMPAVLEYLREFPILSHAASKAGIHRKTLEYWIKRSKAGDDGYDIERDGLMWRFHELVEFAIDEAHDKIFEVALEIAMGVLYKNDLGYEVPHLYVRPPNGKMLRFILEWKRPEVYGKHRKIDVPQRTGVLVIGEAQTPKKDCPAASRKARKWRSASAMIKKAKG